MGRIIIEYRPDLSIITEKLIKENITPSMISNDESSCQYDINMIAKLLYEYDNEDLSIVEKLIKEGINYLEI